jgi:alpha-glucuronidase
MKIDMNIKKVIEKEIETLKKTNADMRLQIEQEINKNQLHIYALERLLQDADDYCRKGKQKDT